MNFISKDFKICSMLTTMKMKSFSFIIDFGLLLKTFNLLNYKLGEVKLAMLPCDNSKCLVLTLRKIEYDLWQVIHEEH
jgi:hypothetical protein